MAERSPSIAVTASAPDLAPGARALARELGLPCCGLDEAAPSCDGFDLLLAIEPGQDGDILTLGETAPRAPKPIIVDFRHGRSGYRRRHGGRESLARAVGLGRGRPAPSVVDATAGLGRDAFVLAGLGCRVTLVERSAVLGVLVRDGLRRAGHEPALKSMVEDRMQLVIADARAYLEELSTGARPDVVYMDPMYPERRKSALVKKEMRLLRTLVGTDADAPALLQTALGRARRRVVVKRPASAPPLAGPAPSFAVEGPTTRYDVYQTGPTISP